jgi:hypothetical protein
MYMPIAARITTTIIGAIGAASDSPTGLIGAAADGA